MSVEATIWTRGKMVKRRLPTGETHSFWEPKCVWRGEIDLMPVKGQEISFQDNIIEPVDRVSYNVLDKTVEIHLETNDEQDFYEDVMGNPFNEKCPRV